MAIRGFRRWNRQPPNGFVEVAGDLPNPFAIFRTLADRQQIFPGPVNSSSTWTGVGSRTFAGEAGLYTSGGGVMHTLAAQPDRQVYAMALRFQQLTTATTQTIFGVNGADNGTQVRINTSEQLELLSEASALLATSSTAPFGNTTAVHTLVVVCPTTTGPTSFYLNGRLLMSYAGAVDNKNLSKYITFGRRGNAGETLTGVIFDAVYWSGPGNVPTLAQCQDISRDYYGTIYAPRRLGPLLGVAAAGGGATVAVPAGSLTLAGQTPTVRATANKTVAVPAGALTLAALAPTIKTPRTVAPPAGTLTLTGFAPVVNNGANITIQVPAGTLTLTQRTPTVTATANRLISVPAGALSLKGYAPTVIGVSVVPASAYSAGWEYSKKKRRREPTKEELAALVQAQREAMGILPKRAQKRVIAAVRQEAEKEWPDLGNLAPMAAKLALDNELPANQIIDAFNATFEHQRARIEAEYARATEQRDAQQAIAAQEAERARLHLERLRQEDDAILAEHAAARDEFVGLLKVALEQLTQSIVSMGKRGAPMH